MARIALATLDTAGGLIGNSQGVASTINGRPIAVRGDSVAGHPPCPQDPAHCAATTTASPASTINGIPITLEGDPATCGHAATASAASTIE
ncbi:MAG: PAAR domain-containing protein [Rhodospirillaceae bacterium]|nr:PAAR domain-containing protein [Rhodospirillaceae bacterium]